MPPAGHKKLTTDNVGTTLPVGQPAPIQLTYKQAVAKAREQSAPRGRSSVLNLNVGQTSGGNYAAAGSAANLMQFSYTPKVRFSGIQSVNDMNSRNPSLERTELPRLDVRAPMPDSSQVPSMLSSQMESLT